MASKHPTDRKRAREPSAQGLKVRFLINIPLKVESEDQAQKRCGYLLDALSESFKEADMEFLLDKNGRKVLRNVAVVFGLNAKHSPEINLILQELKNFKYNCQYLNIRYDIITYTWGRGGTIAKDATETPYQDIREHLKNDDVTKKLLKELRANDPRCVVYFSFIDSDTYRFNSVYSSYLEIVKEEMEKGGLPTVMSTGYAVHTGDDHHIAMWNDRMCRVALAEVHPLLVYYPEPNFCVLVLDNCDTIKESFINLKRKPGKGMYTMESPVLISQVKKRPNFKAVFSDKDPVLTVTPTRFKLRSKGLITSQSAMSGMDLAIGANCNKVLINAETYIKNAEVNDPKKLPGVAGRNRGFIINLFNCETDEEFKELSKQNPYKIEEEPPETLVEAIRQAREYKKFIYELEAKMPEEY